jgi:lipopolysaccharide export system permease protein
VALVLVLVYWAVFAIFNALGLETLLDPWAAAWAPNIFFALLGTYLLLYVPT